MRFRHFAVLIVVTSLSAACARAQSQAPSLSDQARTSAYVSGLQNADGGFGGAAGQASSLGATSSAIRILRNTGGSVRDVAGCINYVKSCLDGESGGFAPKPEGKPDVHTTASGLMAAAELKIVTDGTAEKAIAYFSKNAKSFEEVRIAIAGLEAIKKTSPDFERWTAQINEGRNDDGTWGKGPGQARDTGGRAAALLRMGVKLDKREAVTAALRAGQKSDGGWSKEEGASDLETSYRVMRAFFMMGEKPDLDWVLTFVNRCRQSDGSYSTHIDGPGNLGGTYFATTINLWVRLLNGEPALVETAGFAPLFNGNDLAGWEGDKDVWSARAGMIVGATAGLKHNDFLATDKSYGDFILKLSFRLLGGEASNSGVQFRSVRLKGHEMSGYQADIGNGYWGSLYDESRRNKMLAKGSDDALKHLNKGGWNQYEVRAIGDHITLRLNGVASVSYREEDEKIDRDGKIGLQIHAGGPMEVQFKDVLIQPLPTPTAEDLDKPGFHVRKVKVGEDERNYVVFVPNDYDGAKSYPVVLFLHGSGERGTDGVNGARVGLGAAIAGHPRDYPLIAVFPQAAKTWTADSEDAKAALAALDDVLKSYKTDGNKVILTGLSMGGRGAWSVGGAHPDRFAAVVPVCGHGTPEEAKALKDVPVWSFVGDDDRAQTVLNTRDQFQALKAAGASPRTTEYRAVGHNSWDRAYNDPALIDWMLAQTRSR